MIFLAFILDGPTYPPGPNEEVCILFPPIAILATWLSMRSKGRLPLVGGAICTLSALFVLLPVFRNMADWHYDGFYDVRQVAIFLFSAGFPFLCLVAFFLASKKKPNPSLEPTRYAGGSP